MQHAAGTYYKPSGRAPAGGLLLMPAAGMIAAFALSWIYGYLTYYNPLIYVNGLATAGYGFAIGFAVLSAAKMGKVRNAPVALIFGLICGLAGLYFAWAVWLKAVFAAGMDEPVSTWVFFRLDVMWKCILEVNETGVWSIGRSSKEPVTGIMLWIVWAVEAGIITAIAAYIPFKDVLNTPFCEQCDAWSDEQEDVAILELTELPLLKQALEQQKFEVLTLLPKANADSRDALHLDLHVCEQCKETSYLTVKRVAITTNKEGKDETNTTELVKNLSVPHEVVEQVREIMKGAAPADASAGATKDESTAEAPQKEAEATD